MTEMAAIAIPEIIPPIQICRVVVDKVEFNYFEFD
jgi:hypothetical protein